MVDGAIRYGWSLGTGGVLIIRNLEWGRRILSAHQDISQCNFPDERFIFRFHPVQIKFHDTRESATF